MLEVVKSSIRNSKSVCMINPKKVQEIIKGSLMKHGDMLVGAVRTYELSMGTSMNNRYNAISKKR